MEAVQVALWFAATLGHFTLTSRWTNRLVAAESACREELLFVSAVVGIGSLSAILHAVSIVGGISFTTGFIGLAGWHAAILILGPRARAATPAQLNDIEIAALAMLSGLVLAWIDAASQSLHIDGIDAAHYHVPHAVNFALGGSPFALPATPHLYPMAGSVIAAWFITPLGDGLLIDLVMALWFCLIAAALMYLFRMLTGQSGLAWMSWAVIALFSTPLFRATSLMSADLVFASSFIALLASLTAVWRVGSWRLVDCLTVGSAIGLLVGSKASGPPAAALLVGCYGAAILFRRLIGGRGMSVPGVTGVLVMSAIALASGAVWVIRNFALFGWLTEPWQPTTYLSVLGDIETRRRYSVWRRTRYFAGEWLGPWFVPSLWLAAGMVIETVTAVRVKSARVLGGTRLFAAGAAILSGTVITALLIRSPWTSLDWTHGLSLRYVLPYFALLATFAAAAVFPLSLSSHLSRRNSTIAAAIVAAIAVALLLRSQQPSTAHFAPVPRLGLGFLLIGAAIVVLLLRSADWRPAYRNLAVLGLVVALSVGWAPIVAARDQRERAVAKSAANDVWRQFETDPNLIPPTRRLVLLARASEMRDGQVCGRRRFFVLTRFDEPLVLQSAAYDALVHYAARDVQLARRAGPIFRCDYVISNTAVMETDKGRAIVDGLAQGGLITEKGRADGLVLIGADSVRPTRP